MHVISGASNKITINYDNKCITITVAIFQWPLRTIRQKLEEYSTYMLNFNLRFKLSEV